MKIEEVNKIDFKPKIRFDKLQYYLNYFREIQIENNEVYVLVEKLIQSAYPTYEDQYDKRWEYFYIPIKRNRKTIAVPVWIMEYKKEFFVTIQPFGNLHIANGDKETEKFYHNIFTEILRFIPILEKKDDSILQKLIPYDIRTGKIKGLYILDQLLSQDRKKTILDDYKKFVEKKLEIREISLNDYLNVAAICYKETYHEAENFSPIEMYKKWADGRDGGMLSIKDWNSKNEFYQWYHSGEQAGAHPFEIVFSWHRHGIHLYPPDDSMPYYILRVTNYAYAEDFLKMVENLIKMQIPFETRKINDVLDFLAGDTYFSVNKKDEHNFMYELSKEYKQKYFPHIEWDDIKVVKWKD